MDAGRAQEVDELEESTQIEHSTSKLSIQSEIESRGTKHGTERSSEWITQDEADAQSANLEPDESATQDDDEDQWSCTLCDTCKSLIKDVVEFFFVNSDRRSHTKMPPRRWHNINYLQEMHPECDLCTIVLAGSVKYLAKTCSPILAQLPDWDATLIACSNFDLDGHQVDVSFWFAPEPHSADPALKWARSSRYYGCAWVQIYSAYLPQHESLSEFRLSSHRTDSSETMEKITRWLQTCAAHQACGNWPTSVGSGHSMPSRLLEIDVDSSCHNVRLVLTDSHAYEKRPYVTPSHCWGGQVPAKLLRHNFEQMTRHIPYCDLPLTFQDAISVTHRLGFRYLWIDALCIIQDSPGDWLAQSKDMANIYANCTLNLAAIASEDSMGGLFRDRSPRNVSPFTARIYRQDIVCHRGTWGRDVGSSTLTNRAWVMQERFLAPRVVHFGHEQVYWDCLEMSTSETLPKELGLSDLNKYHDDSKRISIDKALAQGSSCSAVYRLWDRKIRAYSRCALTFPSDRSVAVLGLSDAFAKLLALRRHICVFGMWKTRFAYELMWYHRRLAWPGLRPEPCVRIDGKVPSWSWCSVTGYTLNECFEGPTSESTSHNIRQGLFSILHLHGFDRDDSSSALEDSTVKLFGPMCEVIVGGTDLEYMYCVVVPQSSLLQEGVPVCVHWDNQIKSEIEKLIKSRLYLLLGTIHTAHKNWYDELRYDKAPAFIQAATAVSNVSDGNENRNISKNATVRSTDDYLCLLLKSAKAPAHFERVSYVKCGDSTRRHTWKPEWGKFITRWLRTRDILDKAFQSRDLPSHLHEGIDEYGRYKINLV